MKILVGKAALVLSSVSILGAVVPSSPMDSPCADITVDSAANERITQYVAVVNRTQEVLSNRAPTAGDLRKLVADWSSPELKPLTLVNYDDSIDQGPKSDILRSAMEVSNALRRLAASEKAQGSYDRAAQDYLLATEVANRLRFSDVNSVLTVETHQRILVEELSKLLPNTSEKTRSLLKSNLAEDKPLQSPLNSVIAKQKAATKRESDRLSAVREASNGALNPVDPLRMLGEQVTLARHAQIRLIASIDAACRVN